MSRAATGVRWNALNGRTRGYGITTEAGYQTAKIIDGLVKEVELLQSEVDAAKLIIKRSNKASVRRAACPTCRKRRKHESWCAPCTI